MKPPQHVLVTGGAGFIGSHSVEALLEAGCRVRVLDNLSSGRHDNLPEHEALELVVADIRDAAAVQAAMQGMDACLHLAAQVSVVRSLEDPEASAQHNIVGFINVLQAARATGAGRIVYASSAAVYGQPESLPLAEDAPLAPMSPYGLEKRVDEQYAALYRELYGLSCLGMRYFNVYGPRQDPTSPYAGVISKFVDALRAGQAPQIFGDGGQTRDFVFVKDVATANRAALMGQAQGAMNVATGSSVDLLELNACLQHIMQCDHPPQFHAARSGDIRHSCGNAGRLQAELSLRPTWALEDGLRELVTSV